MYVAIKEHLYNLSSYLQNVEHTTQNDFVGLRRKSHWQQASYRPHMAGFTAEAKLVGTSGSVTVEIINS